MGFSSMHRNSLKGFFYDEEEVFRCPLIYGTEESLRSPIFYDIIYIYCTVEALEVLSAIVQRTP